jgi:hypothetical protein
MENVRTAPSPVVAEACYSSRLPFTAFVTGTELKGLGGVRVADVLPLFKEGMAGACGVRNGQSRFLTNGAGLRIGGERWFVLFILLVLILRAPTARALVSEASGLVRYASFQENSRPGL